MASNEMTIRVPVPERFSTGYPTHDDAFYEMQVAEREMILGFKAVWDEYVEMNADGFGLSETAAKLRENFLRKVGVPVRNLTRIMDEYDDCLSAGGTTSSCNHESE